MNLIEEIEQAKNMIPTQKSYPYIVGSFAITASPWWARIKAALEAAQGMSIHGDELTHYTDLASECPFCIQQNKFHAAMEGSQ